MVLRNKIKGPLKGETGYAVDSTKYEILRGNRPGLIQSVAFG